MLMLTSVLISETQFDIISIIIKKNKGEKSP